MSSILSLKIKVFDNGLAENVNGEINGQLQITLKLDDDTPIYSLTRKEGMSTFSIGGRSVGMFRFHTIHIQHVFIQLL